MITMDHDLAQLHRQALQRQARAKVDQIDELRAAHQANERGLDQRKIAELLATSQSRVHRLLKAIERSGGAVEKTPEEVILRACAYDTDRVDMVEELTRFHYTYGEEAPYPFEGRTPGTWDQVVKALALDMITEDEFDQVRRVVEKPRRVRPDEADHLA